MRRARRRRSSPSTGPGWRSTSQVRTERSRAGSKAIRLAAFPWTSAGTMRCGATCPTPWIAAMRCAKSAGKVSSVGWTVRRLDVIFTSVARGTTTRSAPMREKLVAMPSRNAQPATKLAKAMPTPSITAALRKTARSRRRPTFCAANRISSQRSCRRWAILLLEHDREKLQTFRTRSNRRDTSEF